MAVFVPLPGNEELASELATLTAGELGELQVRHFPDKETYVRVISNVKNRDVFIICTLTRPDEQFVPLYFTAGAIRQLGARKVQLIAPYLAYMRQDRIFHPGEALTSRLFAELLQHHFDRLVTVEPHLHRYASLDEVYDIPTRVVHAASLLVEWITIHVRNPVIIGPDGESAQLAEKIARQAGAPWTVFSKERRGDRQVRVSAPSLKDAIGRTPVLVDDIVSSGATMLQAIRILTSLDFVPAYCLAVHGLCSARTARQLMNRTAGFVTCNTVRSATAALDVAPLIADALASDSAKASWRSFEA